MAPTITPSKEMQFFLVSNEQLMAFAEHIYKMFREDEAHKEKEDDLDSDNYVYGIKGICDLFGCAREKAQRLKNTIIADACMQDTPLGKIRIDKRKAKELYAKHTKKI